MSKIIDYLGQGLIDIAGMLGLSNTVDNLLSDATGKVRGEIKPGELTTLLAQITAEAKSRGETALNKVYDRIARLQNVSTSPAVRKTLQNTMAELRSKATEAQKKVNLANAYEQSNNELTNEISMMSRFGRGSDRAKEIAKKANEQANQIKDIYENIEKEVK